jgi:hypothetical protein
MCATKGIAEGKQSLTFGHGSNASKTALWTAFFRATANAPFKEQQV